MLDMVVRFGARARRARNMALATIAAACALGSTGCLKTMILEGQIASTRKASVAVNSLHDWDVAEKAAMAGLAQMEGMRYLAPDNQDALFMLTRSWASVSFGFIEDAMERAEDEHGSSHPDVDYHKRRAEAAYDRAVWYGQRLIEKRVQGFEDNKKNTDTLKAWLQQFDQASDAENLFWFGYAWVGRVNIAKERPEMVSELFVGVAFIERALELDPTYMYGVGHVALGAYHARTPSAELDEAKVHFDKALALGQGKVLLPQVQYAARYLCAKGDQAAYKQTLEAVLAAGDGDPYQRLPNTIAKRRALRLLNPRRMRDNCGF